MFPYYIENVAMQVILGVSTICFVFYGCGFVLCVRGNSQYSRLIRWLLTFHGNSLFNIKLAPKTGPVLPQLLILLQYLTIVAQQCVHQEYCIQYIYYEGLSESTI